MMTLVWGGKPQYGDGVYLSSWWYMLAEVVECRGDLSMKWSVFLAEANWIQSRQWLDSVTTPNYEMPSHVNIWGLALALGIKKVTACMAGVCKSNLGLLGLGLDNRGSGARRQLCVITCLETGTLLICRRETRLICTEHDTSSLSQLDQCTMR